MLLASAEAGADSRSPATSRLQLAMLLLVAPLILSVRLILQSPPCCMEGADRFRRIIRTTRRSFKAMQLVFFDDENARYTMDEFLLYTH